MRSEKGLNLKIFDMKYLFTKQSSLVLALFFIIFNSGITQSDCEVSLEAVKGEYIGECKKGLANGKGIAKGKDTYDGEFKKGLPDGMGTYSWANGNVYTGEFKKGLKDGKGKLLIQLPGGQTKEQIGFWSEDEYIGENESPYELQYKSPEVLSVRVQAREGKANENALYIEIQHKGRVQQNPDFGFNITTGNMLSRFKDGTSAKIAVSQFPFGFSLTYMGETVELLFYQEKSWTVKLDFNK